MALAKSVRGTGRLEAVQFIQRSETHGGIAPSGLQPNYRGTSPTHSDVLVLWERDDPSAIMKL